MRYFTLIYKIIRLVMVAIYKGYLKPNIKLIKRQSDVCYILGNGPSLNSDIIRSKETLSSSSLLVVNYFAQSELYTQLKPRYYTFADPSFWNDTLNKVDYDNAQILFEKIKEKTDWELDIIVPYAAAKKLTTDFKNYPNINIYYFNTTSFETNTIMDNVVYSKLLGAPLIQNVLVSSIFIAILADFKEINLLGADHSWINEVSIDEKNQVCLLEGHFYDHIEVTNHIPWINVNGNIYKMHELLQDLSYVFKGYHKLREFADYKNVKIFNHTKSSHIDAFERRQYL